jgi:RNA polymerase sigma factor (sigma-70 family)
MKAYDKDFVKQLGRGDRKVQKQLFEKLYAPMFRVCQRYIVQNDEAEDCLMKGFLKAFQQIAQFEYQHEESLFWWIRKIMVNECLMMLRKNNNFFLSIEEDSNQEAGIDADVCDTLNAEDLNGLIMLLPAGYRTVFCLYVIEGYDHREVSEMLDITESTSRTQLAKAKTKLRDMLGKINYEHGYAGK